MSTEWIPNFIRRTINYNPHDILSAQEYNAILNLIISQGDYNSAWLEYLQTEGIPDAIRELSIEQITEAITVAVQAELAALSASVSNKTSRQLNKPMFTLLNIGNGVNNITSLTQAISNKRYKATLAIATNLIDTTAAYLTLAQLLQLKYLGFDIVAYSTDGAPVTQSNMATVVPAAKSFIQTNGFDIEVFVYPEGNSDNYVRNAVCDEFKYAVNMLNSNIINPEGITVDAPNSILGNIAVWHYDSTIGVEDAKEVIDNTIRDNKYLIIQIDTDSENCDISEVIEIMDYIAAKSGIEFPNSIATAMHTIHDTIGNSITTLEHVDQTLQQDITTLTDNTYNITDETATVINNTDKIPMYDPETPKKKHITFLGIFGKLKELFDNVYSPILDNLAPEQGGTDYSLVDTGEKYNWNDKSKVSIGTSGTASSTGINKQVIIIDNTPTEIRGTAYMSQSVQLSTSAAGTTIVFTNDAITDAVLVDYACSEWGLVPESVVKDGTNHTVTIHFNKESTSRTVTVGIYLRML